MSIMPGTRPIYVWEDAPCTGLCVEVGEAALCEPQPDGRCPSCAGGCAHGATLCVENSALDCDAKGRLLKESVCDVACVVGVSEVSKEPLALCALSPDPEPACEGREQTGGVACVDGAMTRCQAGFAVTRLTQNEGACSPSEFCVETQSKPICALEPSPNPSCAGVEDFGHVCVDGVTVFCLGGFVFERGSACSP
ncbi:hypothetical protein [Polyangium sorediatum]|uniref:IGFBP N-terminal domain-containing protein n=1 Tax=Polyangium sorediatum TaxID=889274 RepID=A0ABT6P8B6_9BACT|nr:hypothetical protein [Polyangium sorediatum]MDI1436859.1 hypothetical protein [Polyangium sorediatum]